MSQVYKTDKDNHMFDITFVSSRPYSYPYISGIVNVNIDYPWVGFSLTCDGDSFWFISVFIPTFPECFCWII